MSPANQPSPAIAFKTLVIIHLAFTMAQVLFAVVVIFLNSQPNSSHPPANVPFLYMVPAVAIAGILVGSSMFKKNVAAAATEDTVSSKLSKYQVAYLIRMALAEAPSLFAIIGYFLTGNITLLYFAVAIIIYFITIRPTKDKAATDLNLGYGDL